MVVAPLAAGIVMLDALTPAIAENVSVDDPDVDVEVDDVELEGPELPFPTLLPPPPQAESIAVTATPTKTHDKRGQRTMKPPLIKASTFRRGGRKLAAPCWPS
jgi:hypothetical protein